MTLKYAQRQAITAMIGAALTTSLALSGCSHSTTDSSSSPSSTSPVDYTKLLINPADVVLPGQTFTAAKPASGLPVGGAGVAFVNGDRSLSIEDFIIVARDSATAERAYDAGKQKLAATPNATITNVPVGEGAVMAASPFKDGTRLENTVAFLEGTKYVAMEFDSPVNNPLPQGFPVSIAQQQDAALKSGVSN